VSVGRALNVVECTPRSRGRAPGGGVVRDALAAWSTHPELLEGLVPLVVKRIDAGEDGTPKVAWTNLWVLALGTEEVSAAQAASLWRPGRARGVATPHG
jgi:hypothetical protein